MAFDFKKEYKDLYVPKQKPMVIDVPEMTFIMVDGAGDPNREESLYSKAVEELYSLSYTIKMSKKGSRDIAGYFDYVVPPLEGLWTFKEPYLEGQMSKSDFLWTSMIRQPDFVTEDVFEWALQECARKKPAVDLGKAYLKTFKEGLCVQMMHIGSYDEEGQTEAVMAEFMEVEGLVNDIGAKRHHHEIYLGDPRKTAPEKLKTVLRIPIK